MIKENVGGLMQSIYPCDCFDLIIRIFTYSVEIDLRLWRCADQITGILESLTAKVV